MKDTSAVNMDKRRLSMYLYIYICDYAIKYEQDAIIYIIYIIHTYTYI